MPAVIEAERAANIRQRTSTRHISITELSRSTSWRRDLPGCDVIEILDRGETAGWLVSEEGMSSLLATIADLEESLERSQIEAIFLARPDTGALSGDALMAAVSDRIDERVEAVRGVIGGRFE